MNQHVSTHSANASEVHSSGLGFGASQSDGAKAEGYYVATLTGYREECKDAYLALHARVEALKSGLLARLFRRVFAKKIEELETAMRSMTEVKWVQPIHNVVCTQGKNVMLDAALAGSSYTVVGPYMGLISSVGYSSVPVAADTMASHATWTEAGITNAPTYSGGRKTVSWSAASGGSKSPSSAPVFTFTGSGTVKGAFMCYGTGAVSTVDSTAGSLWSAGLFSGGDQPVVNTNTLTVTYSTSL